MVKKQYICEKCGLYSSDNKQEVEKHESIPNRDWKAVFNGLILKEADVNYIIFRKTKRLTPQHDILYRKDVFRCNHLKRKQYPSIETLTEKLPLLTLHTIYSIKDMKKNQAFDITELTEEEFHQTSQQLKQDMPKIYAETDFKRMILRVIEYTKEAEKIPNVPEGITALCSFVPEKDLLFFCDDEERKDFYISDNKGALEQAKQMDRCSIPLYNGAFFHFERISDHSEEEIKGWVAKAKPNQDTLKAVHLERIINHI